MTMPFGEAGLLGNSMIGEDRGLFYNEATRCGCFIGGAGIALGVNVRAVRQHPDGWIGWVIDTWPWTAAAIECPDCQIVETVATICSHLHYSHNWSRPRIAAWINSIDPTLPANQTPPQERVESITANIGERSRV